MVISLQQDLNSYVRADVADSPGHKDVPSHYLSIKYLLWYNKRTQVFKQRKIFLILDHPDFEGVETNSSCLAIWGVTIFSKRRMVKIAYEIKNKENWRIFWKLESI